MRNAKELRAFVDTAIITSGQGAMPLTLLCRASEEAALRAELKGRRHVKSLSVRVAPDAEFTPLMEQIRNAKF